MKKQSTLGYGFMKLEYVGLENIIPSVVLGNGSVRVSTTYNPETQVTGISLSESTDSRPVGHLFIEDGVPKDPNEDPNFVNENAQYQILFDNPDSIDVVIARLEEAKRRLLSPTYEDEVVFANKGDSEANMLADAEDPELMCAMLQDEVNSKIDLINEMREGLQTIYANHGEESDISSICNRLLEKSRP